MAVKNQTYFPNEGERLILGAIFNNSPSTFSFEVGLFSGIQVGAGAVWTTPESQTAGNEEDIKFADLKLINSTSEASTGTTANPKTLARSNTGFTLSEVGVATTNVVNASTISFNNSSTASWTNPVVGFYLVAVVSTVRHLILYQWSDPATMTVSSTYNVNLNISLN